MDEIVNLERRSMDVPSWSEEDVCSWAKSIGLGEHVDTFLYHNINGNLLLQLSRKELEEDLEVCDFVPCQTHPSRLMSKNYSHITCRVRS